VDDPATAPVFPLFTQTIPRPYLNVCSNIQTSKVRVKPPVLAH
jgi:hypothetical protein